MSKSLSLAIAWLLLFLLAAASAERNAHDAPLDGFERFVEADGRFRFAGVDSTASLRHLGSWFVPEGEASGFHHVYTQPEAIAAYRATGRFPDGTALVKEIVSHRRGSYTTGANVASGTTARRWFLMVKDERGRFPNDPLWGEGWGWALFESDDPTRNVASDLRVDCLGCHAPAAASDWVYVEGYPALRPDDPRSEPTSRRGPPPSR
ncbi:MAG: cytochrome P460 family protein [Spirochaetaceae bacterium]|nr:cytochrome P460 family protein [Myxococcales bacterium]MCB9724224.1 cytochrome P460 family protein [Spirochaetaceae bacterium]HPG24140.1 cytochrome P460 family protein [Myxococcota bacterium]